MFKKIWMAVALVLALTLIVTAITVSAASEKATLNISVVTTRVHTLYRALSDLII